MSAASLPHELDRAVATTLDADGSRRLELTTEWNTPNGTANGGYVLAVLARAVLDHGGEVAPDHPDLLSVSVNYLKPPSPGPAQVLVETVRIGRRISVHQASLVQGGTTVALGVVTLHDWDAPGVDAAYSGLPAPQLPDPDDCLDLTTLVPAGTVPIIDRYDARGPEAPGWLQGAPTGHPEATLWARPKDGRRIDALATAALVDGYPPVTAELDLLASATVQLTVHLRRRPDTAWLLMRISTRHVEGGFHDEDVDVWDEEGRLVAQSRQLAILS